MKSLYGIRVLVGPPTFGDHDKAPLEILEKAGCDIIKNPYKRKLTKDELLPLLSKDVKALIAGLETIDEEILRKANLKVISRCGSGSSNIDLKTAKTLGIKVRFTPNAPVASVAELTIGAMLSLLRHIPRADNEMHEGRWTRELGSELAGKTVVIIGFGRIGKAVAGMLNPFNVKIIAVDPALGQGISRKNIEVMPLEKALPRADIITIHSSGEDEIIGGMEFAMMKDGVFLLNAARGSVVDEPSLISALDSGKIRGAWLDTFKDEPYAGNLKEYPQVVLTPHIGSYTLECRRIMEREAAENLLAALREE